MSLFEFYRMEIPLFVPSPELLTEWHIKYAVLNERSWSTVFGHPSTSSVIDGSRNDSILKNSQYLNEDPNNEFSPKAILQWIRLSDFYQWPHITQFDSWTHLFKLLSLTDFEDISLKMRKFNIQQRESIVKSWGTILDKVSRAKSEQSSSIISLEESLKCRYKMRLRSGCFGTDDVIEKNKKC
jgi:hypothetical protein